MTGGCPTGKAHFTETCEPDRPHLIVHVTTTVATTADVETMPARHADLASLQLLPDEHLVDASYVSADGVLDAHADHGVQLVGLLPPDSGWQARDEDGFDLTRFDIDWDHKQVTCPNGKTARNWRQAAAATACRSCRPPSAPPTARPAPTASAAPARPPTPAISPSDPAASTRPSANSAPSRPPRLAGALRPPLRDRGHHRPGLSPQRPAPRPLPRPAQDPPAARADRAGAQPSPRRRLAHRHAAGRQLGLPAHQTPTGAGTIVNSPAESLRGEVQGAHPKTAVLAPMSRTGQINLAQVLAEVAHPGPRQQPKHAGASPVTKQSGKTYIGVHFRWAAQYPRPPRPATFATTAATPPPGPPASTPTPARAAIVTPKPSAS